MILSWHVILTNWMVFDLLLVSYDVNKDGVKVAVLTFIKSAYRLGESVLGIVELNEHGSRARVLKVRCHGSLYL